ncbi:MAG: hypothetical protein EA342_16760 [Leptolyngbya sp. LCM1.Bin17]|nr:MAG: hypothetical protein EA342_16760 [Leptolyngbya sp. LCM1.Bin17]
MTPETARDLSTLRSKFYHLLGAKLDVAVTIAREKSYASTLPKVSWTDQQQRLNYLCLYAYSAPDILVPDRPLVLRIGVNLGAEFMANTKGGRGMRRYNQDCQFYLTLMPEEVLDAVPWLVVAMHRHMQDWQTRPMAPYGLASSQPLGAVTSMWTQAARQQVYRSLQATEGVGLDYTAMVAVADKACMS